MKLSDLAPFKAEIVALGGAVATSIGMITDHTMLAIFASVPGLMAVYGSYVKGAVTAEQLAKAVIEAAAKEGK